MAVTVIKIPLNQDENKASLGAAFRQLLKDRKISEEELKQTIADHVAAEEGLAPAAAATRVTNLNKELSQVNMSWSAFTKGLQLLGIDEITVLA